MIFYIGLSQGILDGMGWGRTSFGGMKINWTLPLQLLSICGCFLNLFKIDLAEGYEWNVIRIKNGICTQNIVCITL